jgi:translation initiation factor 1
MHYLATNPPPTTGATAMTSKKISLTDWQQQSSTLVYSTDNGTIAADKPEKTSGTAFSDGHLRIKRETKGRNGKAVITIAGLAESHDKLTELAALLKKKCGCGGSVKDGIIEIQGDQREVISQELTKLGYKFKFAGG